MVNETRASLVSLWHCRTFTGFGKQDTRHSVQVRPRKSHAVSRVPAKSRWIWKPCAETSLEPQASHKYVHGCSKNGWPRHCCMSHYLGAKSQCPQVNIYQHWNAWSENATMRLKRLVLHTMQQCSRVAMHTDLVRTRAVATSNHAPLGQ